MSKGRSDGQVQITLQIQAGHSQISGTVAIADGSGTPFSGWLELASLIEDARLPQPAQRAPLPADHG